MDMFFGLVGMFGFFVCLVWVIGSLVLKKKKKPALLGMAIFFVLFLIGVSLPSEPGTEPTRSATSTGSTEPAQESNTPAFIPVSAEELWTAYSENAVNADRQYKDQLIAVTGTISDIGQDLITKAPCISLESGNDFGLYAVQCFFPKNGEQEDFIASLSDGDSVTIIGECKGIPVANVQLSNCYFEE